MQLPHNRPVLSPRRRGWRRGLLLWACALLLAGAQAAATSPAAATQQPRRPAVGVQEQIGKSLSLDVPLVDEAGKTVMLRELVNLPTLLVFVYYRCPAICDPLLRELARNLDRLELVAGTDYRVVTISFDPADTPDVARTKQAEIFGTMQHPPAPSAWRFLTGQEQNVRKLTDQVGFNYTFDPDTQTYMHASSLIFLTAQGKIVRYLGGLEFIPAQLKLAFHDAAEGTPRSFMGTVERLCYAYDPEGRTYVLQVNRLILGATGLFVLGFAIFLTWRRKAARREVQEEAPPHG